MKKAILTYGVIGGLITGAAIVLPAHINPGAYDPGTGDGDMWAVIGYSIMFITSLIVVHLGIRSVRNKENNGFISYWSAFKIGALIMLSTFVIYTLFSGIGFYMAFPEWMDSYIAASIEQIQNNAELTDAVKEEKINELNSYGDVPGILLAAFEALPMLAFGLIVSFVSAAILKKEEGAQVA